MTLSQISDFIKTMKHHKTTTNYFIIFPPLPSKYDLGGKINLFKLSNSKNLCKKYAFSERESK